MYYVLVEAAAAATGEPPRMQQCTILLLHLLVHGCCCCFAEYSILCGACRGRALALFSPHSHFSQKSDLKSRVCIHISKYMVKNDKKSFEIPA